jgi:hypothetical protein
MPQTKRKRMADKEKCSKPAKKSKSRSTHDEMPEPRFDANEEISNPPRAESTRISVEPSDMSGYQDAINSWIGDKVHREDTNVGDDEFNVSLSFHVPHPTVEDTLQEPDPDSTDISTPVGPRFEVVEGATQRGKPMLV